MTGRPSTWTVAPFTTSIHAQCVEDGRPINANSLNNFIFAGSLPCDPGRKTFDFEKKITPE